MHRLLLAAFTVLLPAALAAQHAITIDGNFDDWSDVPVAITDPADDVHDTDGNGTYEPSYRAYTDCDLLEVKFTNDAENLYGYMRATGVIGRTSADTLGHGKNGRYYFIFTIDVDDNDTTGYRLGEGGYWPDSRGYDMNMEAEFYRGGYNTGHYINHEFLTEQQAQTQGLQDLADGIVRLAPGTYDYYTQWVTFEDSSYVLVSDRGPVHYGIITIAVSPDGHEAEMKAPMWGFLKTPEGAPIIDVDQYIDVSASLEGSGELSEHAISQGHTTGSKSVWGSDTAAPFRYYLAPGATRVADAGAVEHRLPRTAVLRANYPNPIAAGGRTLISYGLPAGMNVRLSVVNLLGQEVARLADRVIPAGDHLLVWSAQNQRGGALAPGIYFALLEGDGFRLARPMLIVR